MRKRFSKKKIKRIRLFYLVLILVTCVFTYSFIFHFSNTSFKTQKFDLYIPSDSLNQNQIEEKLLTATKLDWTLNLAIWISGIEAKKGLYYIDNKSSNAEILNLLKQPQKEIIKVEIGNLRFRYNATARICKNLDIRSRALRNALNDLPFLQSIDSSFNKENSYALLVQDSLWVYKEITARELVKSLHRKWSNYWTEENVVLAKKQNLTPLEAVILASIVQAESQKVEELPKIAGLYLNRLKKDMKLQADPTVIYAIGQKNIHRVLKRHLRVKNPYNTYRYKGLPPGPVYVPSKEALNAVLNPENHDYFYFVANPELNGYHDFSVTYEEHREKAKRYREKLNKKRIYK